MLSAFKNIAIFFKPNISEISNCISSRIFSAIADGAILCKSFPNPNNVVLHP